MATGSEVSASPGGTVAQAPKANSNDKVLITLASVDVRDAYVQASSVQVCRLDPSSGAGKKGKCYAPSGSNEGQYEDLGAESNQSSPWQSNRSAAYYEQRARREFDLYYGQDPSRSSRESSLDSAPLSAPEGDDAQIANLFTREAARLQYEQRQPVRQSATGGSTVKVWIVTPSSGTDFVCPSDPIDYRRGHIVRP